MTSATTAVRAAYDLMAPVYDRFTQHHDYDAWTATIEALALRHGLRGRSLLDAGCGTGKSFQPFLRRGYAVTAFDVSPAMAAIAAAKAPEADVRVHDVCTVPALGRFDLVCCLDDCLNHLVDPRSLVAALKRLAANLAGDGILVFDLNTLATYRGFFAELVVQPGQDEVLVWCGEADPRQQPSTVATATLTAYRRARDGAWRAAVIRHRQRHHARAEVLAALTEAGLTAAAVYGQGLDGVPHETLDEESHTKAVYVVRHAR